MEEEGKNNEPKKQHEPRLGQICRTETQIKQTSAKQSQGKVKSRTMKRQETQHRREPIPTASEERAETRESDHLTSARDEQPEQQVQIEQVRMGHHRQPVEQDKTARKKAPRPWKQETGGNQHRKQNEENKKEAKTERTSGNGTILELVLRRGEGKRKQKEKRTDNAKTKNKKTVSINERRRQKKAYKTKQPGGSRRTRKRETTETNSPRTETAEHYRGECQSTMPPK